MICGALCCIKRQAMFFFMEGKKSQKAGSDEIWLQKPTPANFTGTAAWEGFLWALLWFADILCACRQFQTLVFIRNTQSKWINISFPPPPQLAKWFGNTAFCSAPLSSSSSTEPLQSAGSKSTELPCLPVPLRGQLALLPRRGKNQSCNRTT